MKSTIQKFWDRVQKTKNGCWIWTAMINEWGYGILVVKRKRIKAHRLSWQLHNGKIPNGKFVCHHCDNPACVNPKHLFVGTAADNTHDMMRKERQARGEKHGSSKLTTREVIAIRNDVRPQLETAQAFGISKANVCRIQLGQLWSHV